MFICHMYEQVQLQTLFYIKAWKCKVAYLKNGNASMIIRTSNELGGYIYWTPNCNSVGCDVFIFFCIYCCMLGIIALSLTNFFFLEFGCRLSSLQMFWHLNELGSTIVDYLLHNVFIVSDISLCFDLNAIVLCLSPSCSMLYIRTRLQCVFSKITLGQ